MTSKDILRQTQRGFTLVEMLVVIVIIGVLARVVFVTFQVAQTKATDSEHRADLAILQRAINIARLHDDKTLFAIDGLAATDTSLSKCQVTSTEPKTRLKTDICWTTYINSLNNISAASGVNLNALKKGDKRGNPYTITENEERVGCTADYLGWFVGNGITTDSGNGITLDPYTLACQ